MEPARDVRRQVEQLEGSLAATRHRSRRSASDNVEFQEGRRHTVGRCDLILHQGNQGEMTTVSPGRTRAGSWKRRDFLRPSATARRRPSQQRIRMVLLQRTERRVAEDVLQQVGQLEIGGQVGIRAPAGREGACVSRVRRGRSQTFGMRARADQAAPAGRQVALEKDSESERSIPMTRGASPPGGLSLLTTAAAGRRPDSVSTPSATAISWSRRVEGFDGRRGRGGTAHGEHLG
jgi:hypothetical protein